ncbi:hypothetical protein Hanom_Chr06g00496191 [Helianthus anomalus]
MEPIKSNHHISQYPPLDHAEMKSQPFKLPKLTAMMAVFYSYLQFSQFHTLSPMNLQLSTVLAFPLNSCFLFPTSPQLP